MLNGSEENVDVALGPCETKWKKFDFNEYIEENGGMQGHWSGSFSWSETLSLWISKSEESVPFMVIAVAFWGCVKATLSPAYIVLAIRPSNSLLAHVKHHTSLSC